MTDLVVITYDPEGSTDDVWDDNTGQYTRATGDEETVYRGPAQIVSQGWSPTSVERGGGEMIIATYEIAIPISARKILKDSLVFCYASLRNPNVIGMQLTVMERNDVSNAVAQKLLGQRYTLRRTL